MKILSLKEPFATLVKNNIKSIETRSWKTKYRGELYIHTSSSKILKKHIENTELVELFNEDDLNYGYIICKCNLVDCIYMTKDYVEEMKKSNHNEYVCGLYEEGRYAWILEDIEILDNPIFAKGKLGIWNYEEKKSYS